MSLRIEELKDGRAVYLAPSGDGDVVFGPVMSNRRVAEVFRRTLKQDPQHYDDADLDRRWREFRDEITNPKSRARFMFYWEDFFEDGKPCANFEVTDPMSSSWKSTLDAEGLKAIGIEVPEHPTFEEWKQIVESKQRCRHCWGEYEKHEQGYLRHHLVYGCKAEG